MVIYINISPKWVYKDNDKQIKKYSISLVIREILIKKTMSKRYEEANSGGQKHIKRC